MADTLESLTKDLLDIAQRDYPRETKKFLRSEGNKLKRRVKAEAKKVVGSKTGTYAKSWKRGKPYKYSPTNSDAVRVYNSSPHAHLIEYGHEIVGHAPDRRSTGKRAKAFHVTDKISVSFSDEFERDVDSFIDKLFSKL